MMTVPPRILSLLRTVSVHLPPRNFITLHHAYFIGICLFSSIIFWGASTPPRSISYTDSLFFVVSAMTLAGLNTVNLSELNTFQQFLLFILIMLGSAIFVSFAVVHIRRKAFKQRFKRIIDRKRKRQDRKETIDSRRWLSLLPFSYSKQSELETDVVASRRSIIPSDQPEEENEMNDLEIQRNHLRIYRKPSLAQDNDLVPGGILDQAKSNHPNFDPNHDENPQTSIDPLSHRVTFAASMSPIKARTHTRVFSMQGVGARQNIMNHPSQSSLLMYAPTSSSKITQRRPVSQRSPLDFLSPASFLWRNSQFSSLTPAERDKLGGVEYRALTFLAIVVPTYFVLWQFLGSIGLGAYIASKRAESVHDNGLNPWYVLQLL